MWWNIIIGVIFIIGGVSGYLVLRGTENSTGLAVFGLALVLLGVNKWVWRNL